jgi:hypothetical protein
MSTSINLFQRYWAGWEGKLSPLIRDRNGARLYFPPALKPESADGVKYSLRPLDPIFIYNAPTKSSSTREKATKLCIFIDGTFEVEKVDEQPCMHKADCNVTFYKCEEDDQGTHLEFFDAMHFDFELADQQTPFHPIFHVQRGVSRTVNSKKVRELFKKHCHIEGEQLSIVEDTHNLGTPYLRLPTPQLDLFSLMTLVIADFFCRHGQDKKQNEQVRTSFKAILDYLRDEENIIREGHGSRRLKTRMEGTHMSTAHWYGECA